MSRSGFVLFSWLAIVACSLMPDGRSVAQVPSATPPSSAAPSSAAPSSAAATQPSAAPVNNIIALLNAIDPYRITQPIDGKIQVFGATSMDNMAHAWADEFRRFHPQVAVEISAAGSGDAFVKLKQNPKAVAMLSRPVKPDELEQLKSETIKHPAAFVVAREALGVYVHESNPIQSINGEQLRMVFTKQGSAAELKWKDIGVTGAIADKPVHLVSRSQNSGTQAFLRDFVFGGLEMRESKTDHLSNSDVLGALATDPLGITICGLRVNAFDVKSLPLVHQGVSIPSDDAAVLSGQYPLTRHLTLVIDLEQTDKEAKASQEFVHFALCRTGQLSAIRAGFYPAELPVLRAGLGLIQKDHLR